MLVNIILKIIFVLILVTLIVFADLSFQKIADKKNLKMLQNNFVRMFLSYLTGIFIFVVMLKLIF